MGVRVPAPRRVAIIEPMNFGDLLCTVPLLRALRKAWPEAEMVLVADHYVESFHRFFRSYLDRLLLVDDDLAWAPPERLADIAGRLRKEEFDVVLKLYFWLGRRPETSYWDEHPNAGGQVGRADPAAYWRAHERSLQFAAMIGAPTTVGVAEPDAALPPGVRGVPYLHDGHVIDTLLQVADVLGVPADGRHMELPVEPAERAAVDALLGELGRDGRAPLVGLHPGASVRFRRWPAERFSQVGDALVEEFGARIVVTGTTEEAEVAAAVVRGMRHADRVLDLSGRTTLGEVAAVFDRLALLVSNDTGTIHVAAARRRPSIVLFGVEREALQWRDPEPERQRALVTPDPRGELSHHETIRRIPVAAVLDAARELLRR